MKEFREMNLKQNLLGALGQMGFNTMTEVQELSIPVLLDGKDLIVRSKTGSGKTGAFLVPIFQNMEPRGYPQALVVLPTRELAVQVSAVARKLSQGSNIRIAIVYGGASINVQMQSLRHGADIVIGTPGRLIDLMDRGSLKLNRIKFLVLDEADLMLDMGFIEDVELIISMAPRERQTILMSATMPREITEIARHHMRPDAVKLTVGSEENLTVETITHGYFIASGRTKFEALMAYIEKFNPKKCIIFTSTQRESEYVHRFLSLNNHDAIVMHGGLTQSMRERSLRAFREHARFLISTNLASRGLDIPDITDVINFDAPEDPKVYIHRVGRSARMGKDGRAFTIFGYDQESLMEATRSMANVKMEHLKLETVKFTGLRLPEARGRGRESRGRPFHRQQGPRGGFRGGRDGRQGGGWGNRGGSERKPFRAKRHEYGSSG
ncbi:MAG: DEAD/DEAH box helicase [Candidatus Micrarchaeota archaeon]|nr:DEAD/DEAH box helicase [Candidatus Micrarchaeota archaeon]